MKLLKIVIVLAIVLLIGRFLLSPGHIKNGTLGNSVFDLFIRIGFLIVLVVLAYSFISSIMTGGL